MKRGGGSRPGPRSLATSEDGAILVLVAVFLPVAVLTVGMAQDSQHDLRLEFRHIAAGIGAGKYGPSYSMTRADFVLMLYGEIADYAKSAVMSLVRAGVITGSGGKINPRGNITRAEMATILYRILTME